MSDPFDQLRKQRACPGHKWLPREQVRTSHGVRWMTTCSLCGAHISRGDYGDLSEAIEAEERATTGDSGGGE